MKTAPRYPWYCALWYKLGQLPLKSNTSSTTLGFDAGPNIGFIPVVAIRAMAARRSRAGGVYWKAFKHAPAICNPIARIIQCSGRGKAANVFLSAIGFERSYAGATGVLGNSSRRDALSVEARYVVPFVATV